jgi:NAD(P)H-dependent FMN reductase
MFMKSYKSEEEMKKILVIPGSSSKKSINKELAAYSASQVTNAEYEVIDLNDYELPLYSVDREEEFGIPIQAIELVQKIENSDGVIVSLAEHNGSYAAAFKNILDWASRHKQGLWSEKSMLLMSTSPGARGGATVLQSAATSFPFLGAKVVATYSLPSFYDNFSVEGIVEEELKSKFNESLDTFAKAL